MSAIIANKFWIDGVWTADEPSTPEDEIVHESLDVLEQRAVTGNDMTAIEIELRRAYQAGKAAGRRAERQEIARHA